MQTTSLLQAEGYDKLLEFCTFLRYAKSSQRFAEIEQVSIHSNQVCKGPVRTNAWNTSV